MHHRRKQIEADGEIEELLDNARLVLAIDVRGIGEMRDKGSNAKYHSHDHRTSTVAIHIGRPLLGQRVEDILTTVEYLRSQMGEEGINPHVSPVHLIGTAAMTPLVLHAAALDLGINTVELRYPMVKSYISDLVAKPLHKEMAGLVVPGALKMYDLPDLVNFLGDRLTLIPADEN